MRSTDGAVWELDPLVVHSDLRTPLCWFGHLPTLFEAPARLRRSANDWTALSVLCCLTDAAVTSEVTPLVAFEWGFISTDEEVVLKNIEAKDLGPWDEQLRLLRRLFPEWTLLRAGAVEE